MYGTRTPKGLNSSMQSQYMNDPRMALAMELQRTGSNTAPVSTHLEGLSRMLQGAMGGYQAKAVGQEYENRSEAMNSDLARALASYQGTPAQNDLPGPSLDGSAGYDRPAVDSDAQMAANILLGNPDTQDMGMKLLISELEAKRKASEPIKLGAGDILYDPKTGKPVYTAPAKASWESVNDPMFGKGQKNTQTGEFKPVKTDVQDPAKAQQAKAAALEVTNRLLSNVDGVKANRGGISTLFPNVSDAAVNAEADLNTLASLLTVENLGILKGVLSDTDMQVLKDIGAGGLKGADDQVLSNLRTIQAKLQGQTGAPAQAANFPTVGKEEDGYIFMGGDPANPASWRKK